MAEKKTEAAAPVQIADVAKPGKSAPSASAKPIIVTNRPVLKDPMMVDETTKTNDSAASAAPLTHLKIGPLSDAEKQVPATAPTSDEPAAVTKTNTTSDENPKRELVVDPPHDETVTDTVASELTAEADKSAAEPDTAESDLTVSDEAPAKPDPTDAHAEADQAAADLRTKELADLVESRKFYLPINQVEKRKAKRYVWAGVILIVLLAVAWADVAADAGLISIPGIKAPTHFFSN